MRPWSPYCNDWSGNRNSSFTKSIIRLNFLKPYIRVYLPSIDICSCEAPTSRSPHPLGTSFGHPKNSHSHFPHFYNPNILTESHTNNLYTMRKIECSWGCGCRAGAFWREKNIFCLCQILWSYIIVMATSIKISARGLPFRLQPSHRKCRPAK